MATILPSATPVTEPLKAGRVRLTPPPLAVAAPLVLIIVFAFISRSMLLAAVALLASLALIATHLPLFAAAGRAQRQTSLLMLLVTSASLPIAAWRGETAVVHFAVAMLMFGVAFVLTRDGRLYLKVSHWALLLTQGAVFAYLARTGLANFPLERMIPASSSNGITSYLIVLQANYCIARYILDRKSSLVTPLLTVLICIVGYGRGSLLASVALLGLNVLPLFSFRRPARAAAMIIILASASVFTWVRYGEVISTFVEANTKIGAGLYDSNRELQIREYVAQLDGVALLVGGEYRGTSIERRYNNNPHNSFIRAHHIFGLPYLVLVLIFPLLSVAPGLSLGQRFYAFGAFFVMLFRASTEPILFPTMLDLFFFGACFVMALPQRKPADQRA